MNAFRIIVLSLLVPAVLATAACGGWQLRGIGRGDDDLKVIYADVTGAPLLRAGLNTEFYRSGIVRTLDRKEAQMLVSLSGERYQRRVLSVDPDSGKVREVEVQLRAVIEVKDDEGNILLPQEEMSWEQDFVFDETSVLGTGQQESFIRRELAENAARIIVYRLDALY